MGHRHDYIDEFRGWLFPNLHRLFVQFNRLVGTRLYAETRTDKAEFVGYVYADEETTEQYLHEMGFVRNPLAAWKRKRLTHEEEVGSFAWRGYVNGDRFYRDPFADKQLHVILYPVPGNQNATAAFAHWEYSWVTHPVKHYRGEDMNDEFGAELCRRMFDRHGILYDTF